MQSILLFAVIAVTVEALVEYAANIIEGECRRTLALRLSALGASIALCLLAGADVYAQLDIAFAHPAVGPVLTGVFASRGANWASDILARLQKAAG